MEAELAAKKAEAEAQRRKDEEHKAEVARLERQRKRDAEESRACWNKVFKRFFYTFVYTI